jgi:hypothetical protein
MLVQSVGELAVSSIHESNPLSNQLSRVLLSLQHIKTHTSRIFSALIPPTRLVNFHFHLFQFLTRSTLGHKLNSVKRLDVRMVHNTCYCLSPLSPKIPNVTHNLTHGQSCSHKIPPGIDG